MATHTWKDVQDLQIERAMPRILDTALARIESTNFFTRAGAPPLAPPSGFYDDDDKWVSYLRLDIDGMELKAEDEVTDKRGCAP